MNCDLACHLIDDYLEKQLSQYDARRLEQHLRLCPACARELQDRPRFERIIRHALAAMVQDQHLSAEASLRIVQHAQARMRRAVWSNRIYLAGRVAAGVVAVALVLVGLFVLLNGLPAESQAGAITLFPLKYLGPADQPPASHFSRAEPSWSGVEPEESPIERGGSLSLDSNDVSIEPWTLKPGEMFTITLFLRTDLPRPLDSARFDLDVNGPTGFFHFEVTVRGPLPSHGISVLQITPDMLAASSQEKYLLSPQQVFAEPGVYTVQILLYSPVSTDEH